MKQSDSIPLGDRVLVKVVKTQVIKNGLIIPDVGSKLAMDGIVVAIGDGWDRGTYKSKPVCKVGDRVVFNKYAGIEIVLEGQDHIVMGFQDVLGVAEPLEAA